MPAAPVTANSKNPLTGAVEILPERLYFVALKSHPNTSSRVVLRSPSNLNKKMTIHFFQIDNELVYWNFFLDFGPLNLGQLYRFCTKLNSKLESDELRSSAICFYTSATQAEKRANAIFLICAWQVLYLKRTPAEAWHGFSVYNDNEGSKANANRRRPTSRMYSRSTSASSDDDSVSSPRLPNDSCSIPPLHPLTSTGRATIEPLPSFHDASPCACTYDLNILDCLQGLRKARKFKFFDFSTFDVKEYEYYEQVENGDLNWIIQDRIMAFAGPSYKKTISPEGYCTLAPSDYIPYFKRKNVALVVRLNKKGYDEQEFIRAGISHLEQFYVDGSCPPMKILRNVLNAFEAIPRNKAFAVHCKAGLGRTGTCIGAYIMKHYRFTAAEVIAWMRICRPGCVIGPQQHFLEDLEPVMWQEGEAMRNGPLSSNMVRIKKQSQQTSGKPRPSSSNPNGRNGRLSKEIAREAVVGRSGQADGLLARRHQQQQRIDTVISAPSSSKPGGRKPTVVTPDSTSANRPSTKYWRPVTS